tara:strand:- start:1917 stop:2375 length:459 start_codon:yes stop_codon:yes gene_type:complete
MSRKVTADRNETLVLDGVAGAFDFFVAANYAAAIVDPNARSARFSAREKPLITVTVEVTANTNLTEIFIGPRSSGKVSPDTSVAADWNQAQRLADVDLATGEDSGPPHYVKMAVSGLGRFATQVPWTNRWGALAVWATGVGRGRVYIHREPR